MIKLTLLGQPLSTQNCYRSTTRNGYNRSYMKQACVDLKQSYQWQARQQYKSDPTTEEITLEVRLFHGTKRKVDIDNFNKLIFDALTGIIYEDDSQITKLVILKDYDKANPRIEIDVI